ncbi:ATP-binding protein [Gilliamella sp. Pas-s95]|uniref:ATP-binding protein n=1 Tax=Gilliamella sp. Pas-s95 TaxID=2687317 RepID=UPI00132B91BB|nr:ATP-binding protein [Gilliamella sp. Pas-s95]MWN05172.1 ATP-binding protein [Gilliamella sp. Pas-s95]
MEKEYKLNIDPKILELLGPSLYTNIYYILAELIANAYDADAHNVYIIADKDYIAVEDDGTGMSYEKGDIAKYLNVAGTSRLTAEDSVTKLNRNKMGRKGVGKLAALSVSENVFIKTISNGEKSGFILSRNINQGNLLTPLDENDITFCKISGNGTAVVMTHPQYKLHSTLNAIKRNLLKIFPLVSNDFKIHIIRDNEEIIIDKFDKEMIKELSTLIILGDEFEYLNEFFTTPYDAQINELLKIQPTKIIPIRMADKQGDKNDYSLEIKGWIGTYMTTRGRKVEMTDFPDNFISLYSNKKMGEFNILPFVGQNKLPEVYVVGQLHVDIFERTELPDMALSNRQGYKSDDPRYQAVLAFVRNTLLPDVLKIRDYFVTLGKEKKKLLDIKKQKNLEIDFKKSVDTFRENTTNNATSKISLSLGLDKAKEENIKSIIAEQINTNSPDMGIKSKIDSQKKKILISQTYPDKDLADIVYEMLLFNNVPPEDIIYTNCDDEISRIPEGDVGNSGIYGYLRQFFVDSYSTQKIYVIFVTSDNTKVSWGALVEVGAAWITQIEHKIFNIRNFRPEHPLDDEQQWHSSSRDPEDDNKLYMPKVSADIFCQKIEYICDKLEYTKQKRIDNMNRLQTLVKITTK